MNTETIDWFRNETAQDKPECCESCQDVTRKHADILAVLEAVQRFFLADKAMLDGDPGSGVEYIKAEAALLALYEPMEATKQ